jgi:molybdopterin converting factor small subunit
MGGVLTEPTSATGMIAVRVALFADLRRFAPPGHRSAVLSLPAGATVRDALRVFAIPEEMQITVGRNGDLATVDTPLNEGDEVILMNPMEGG